MSQLKTAYLTYILPILEYACPVWGPHVNNTNYLSDHLESLQKRVFRVILSDTYVSYELALSVLQIPSIRDRRLSLIFKFG